MLLPAWSLVCALSPSLADDWPCWGGPARDGVSAEVDWSSTPAPAPVWTRQVGLGYSTVAVADGRLYTTGHDPERLVDTILCLDARTGEERWRHELAAATMDTFHGGGTLATPVVEDGRVYVNHREGHVLALDARDGTLLWRRELKDDLELAPTTYGYSASALLDRGRLVIAMGGALMALDPASGELAWRSADLGDGCYANPLPFAWHGRDSLVVFGGPGIVVVDATDGAELARAEVKGPGRGSLKASTPLVLGERVLVSGAFELGTALVDFSGDAPTTVWHGRSMRSKISGVYPWEGALYGFDESMLKCVDLETGEERWRVRGLGMGALSIAGGRLLVLSSRGELIVADADPTAFHELSRTPVLDDGGVFWTAPVLANGLVYCRSSLGGLACVDVRGAVAAAATDAAADVATPTPAALVARHLALAGTAPAGVRMEGTFECRTQGITEHPMTLAVAGGRWALSVDMDEYGALRRGCDGTVAWSLDPFYGNDLPAGPLLADARDGWPVLDLTRYGDLAGPTRAVDFGGTACWAVRATGPAGHARTLYFDRASGWLAGYEGEGSGLVRLEGWTSAAGATVPTRVSVLVPETGIEDRLRIDVAQVADVPGEAFARPDEVARLLRTPEEIAAADEALRATHADLLGTYVAHFEPFEGKDAVLDVAEGDLRLVLEGAPPFALLPPDQDGVFVFRERPELSLRFERDAEGRATAILLKRPENDEPERMERKGS